MLYMILPYNFSYKSQHTIESLNDPKIRQELKETIITEDAIIQLLKITENNCFHCQKALVTHD